jgi:nicotinamidase-related amidase
MAVLPSVDRKKTAVIIMDYQIMNLSYFPEEKQNELISNANKVAAAARQKGIPVVFLETQKGERTREIEIHPQLFRQPGELVLTKKKSGPFSTTNLDERMKKKGIDTLVIMGIYTGGCVTSTVKWAAEMDYKMFVLSDCCAERDEELQRVLMEKLLTHKATVVTADCMIEVMGKS